MNKKQRCVILIGCIIVAGMTLFPPYRGIQIKSGDNLTAFAGYHCIFAPPSTYVVCRRLYADDTKWYYNNYGPRSYRDNPQAFISYIDAQRLTAQLVAVVLITFGLAVVFQRRKTD